MERKPVIMYIYYMLPMLIILFHSERSIPLTRDNAAELLIPFGTLVAAVIWLGIYLRRKAVERMKPVADYYEGKAYSTFLGENVMTGAYKNRPFEIRSCDNSRNMYFKIKKRKDHPRTDKA